MKKLIFFILVLCTFGQSAFAQITNWKLTFTLDVYPNCIPYRLGTYEVTANGIPANAVHVKRDLRPLYLSTLHFFSGNGVVVNGVDPNNSGLSLAVGVPFGVEAFNCDEYTEFMYELYNPTDLYNLGWWAARPISSFHVLFRTGVCSRPTITTNVTNVSCNGASSGAILINASGGTAPYSYSINNGYSYQASGSFTGLTVGSYPISVNNTIVAPGPFTGFDITSRPYIIENNVATCSNRPGTAYVTITQPPAIALTTATTVNNVTCPGLSDGSVTLSVSGGGAPYSYSKDGTTFQASPTFTGLSAGSHTFTVKDANGCLKNSAINITEPTIVLSGSSTPPLCIGGNNGAISLTATGGTSPYSYSKDGINYQTSETFNGLTAGAYTMFVKDAIGCTKTTTVTVLEPSLSSITSTISNVGCKGDYTGIININDSKPGTTYALGSNAFQASGIFSGLPYGNYIVSIKQANGCTSTQSYSITEPIFALGASSSMVGLGCDASATGTINVTATGGTIPYQYSKDGLTFQTSSALVGLSPNTYNVKVKDAKGCLVALTQTIPVARVLTAALGSSTNPNCYQDNTGSIAISATSNNGGLQYALNGGSYQASNQFLGLMAGVYTVNVKDNLCNTQVSGIAITDPNNLVVSLANQTNVLCRGNTTGAINLSTSGGTGTIQFSKDDLSYQGLGSFTGLTFGNYTLYAKDAKGCKKTIALTLTEPAAVLGLSVGTQTNISCKGDATGSVILSASGGTSPYTYSKDGTNFVASNAFTGLNDGAYTFTVKDAAGCSQSLSTSISYISNFSASIGTVQNLSCYQGGTGSIKVNTTNAVGVVQYKLGTNPFQNSDTFNSLAAGVYQITVKDDGCTRVLTPTITEPNNLILSLANQTNILCRGNTTGAIILSTSGGAPYSFLKTI